jgi:hypothetical protein
MTRNALSQSPEGFWKKYYPQLEPSEPERESLKSLSVELDGQLLAQSV